MKYKYDAFISYSHKDKADVDLLYEKLKKYPVLFKRRRKIFKDSQELVAGKLNDRIRKALKESNFLVVCNSNNAVESEWVDVEIEEFIKSRENRNNEHILCCQVGEKLPRRSSVTKEVERIEKEQKEDLFLPDLRGWDGAKKQNCKKELKKYELEALSILAPILGLPDKESVKKEYLKRMFVTFSVILMVITMLGLLSTNLMIEKKNTLKAESSELANKSMVETKKGNARKGIKLALNALTKNSKSIIERPFSYKGVHALYYALHHYRPVPKSKQFKKADIVKSSPDGKYLITSLKNQTQLREPETGKKLLSLEGVYTQYCPDRTCLITELDDHQHKFWDSETGAQKFVIKGPGFEISPKGKYAVTKISENEIQLWNLKTGNKQNRFPGKNPIFSTKGNYVITQKGEKEAQIWNINTGQALFDFTCDYSLTYSNLQVANDEEYLLSPISDNNSNIWNINTRKNIGNIPGSKFAFHPTKNIILAEVTENGSVLFEINNGNIKNLKEIPGVDGRFSPDGILVATTSDDYNYSYLRDINFDDRVKTVEGHSCEFVASGKYFYTVTNQFDSYLWETSTGKLMLKMGGFLPEFLSSNEFYFQGKNPIYFYDLNFLDRSVIVNEHYDHYRADGKFISNNIVFDGRYPVFNSDNSLVLTIKGIESIYDGTAMLWEVKTGKQVKNFAPVMNVKKAYFSPKENFIVTEIFSQNNYAILWDAKSYETIQTIKGKNLIFSDDQKYILTQIDDNQAQIWKISSKTYQKTTIKVPGKNFELSYDARYIASVIDNETTRITQIEGSQTVDVGIIEGINPKICPSNIYIATELRKNDAIKQNKVLLYDLKTGKYIREFNIGGATINYINFHWDNKYIAFALTGGNGIVKIFEIDSGNIIAQLDDHNGVIYNAKFKSTPDGQYIITASHTIVDALDYMQGEGEKFNWLMYKWRFFHSHQDLIDHAKTALEKTKFIESIDQ